MIIAQTYPPENISARQRAAVELFGPLEFMDETALLPCPAEHLHRKKDERPAKLYLRGAPSIYCFHDSCREEIWRLNQELRRRVAQAERGEQPAGGLVVTRTAGPSLADKKKRWAAMGRRVLAQALEMFPMGPADLASKSPHLTTGELNEDFCLFMRTLWRPHEIVWCGERWNSGQPRHADFFKPAAAWAEAGRAPGPLTSPFCFKPGSHSRSRDQVEARRHLVLESDQLNQEQSASVFWWVKERLNLPLEAVVHSGNNSIHAWFVPPPEERLPELQEVLAAAGMDGQVLKATSQPVRLPGWHRRDKAALHQALLYLDPQACPL